MKESDKLLNKLLASILTKRLSLSRYQTQCNSKARKKNKNKIRQIPLTIKRSKKKRKNSKRKLNYLKRKELERCYQICEEI